MLTRPFSRHPLVKLIVLVASDRWSVAGDLTTRPVRIAVCSTRRGAGANTASVSGPILGVRLEAIFGAIRAP